MPESVVVLEIGSTLYAADYTSPDLGLSAYEALDIDITISALTGTAPTATFYFDRKGADGNYYNIWASTAQNTPGSVSDSIGAGLNKAMDFGSAGRFRAVRGGTGSPTVTFSLSIQAK